jgi:hypothetical protein
VEGEVFYREERDEKFQAPNSKNTLDGAVVIYTMTNTAYNPNGSKNQSNFFEITL